MASSKKPAASCAPTLTPLTRSSGAVPAAIQVSEFVGARKEAVESLLDAGKAFLKVPFRLRRRAKSFRPYRASRLLVATKRSSHNKVPWTAVRIKQWYLQKRRREKQTTAEDNPLQKIPLRRHRRRAGVFLYTKTAEEKNPKILHTHIWHAKRCHMADVWGWRLPRVNSGVSGRAVVRRARGGGMVLHDRSYMTTVDVISSAGAPEFIVCVLERCGVPRELLLSETFAQGKFRGVLSLFHVVEESSSAGSPSTASLEKQIGAAAAAPGPVVRTGRLLAADVRYLWRGRSNLRLWVHPSARTEVLVALQEAAAVICAKDEGGKNVEIVERGTNFCWEVFGGGGLRGVLSKIFEDEDLGKTVGKLKRGQVLERTLRFSTVSPRKLPSEVPDASDLATIRVLFVKNDRMAGSAAQPRDLQGFDMLFEDDSFGTSELPREQERVLPLAGFPDDDETEALLRQLDRIKQPLIALWLRLVFAGAFPIGYEDRHTLLSEHLLPEFPFDYPDSAAGDAYFGGRERRRILEFAKRPRSKRVNYALTKIHSPFRGFWPVVGGQWAEPAVDYEKHFNCKRRRTKNKGEEVVDEGARGEKRGTTLTPLERRPLVVLRGMDFRRFFPQSVEQKWIDKASRSGGEVDALLLSCVARGLTEKMPIFAQPRARYCLSGIVQPHGRGALCAGVHLYVPKEEDAKSFLGRGGAPPRGRKIHGGGGSKESKLVVDDAADDAPVVDSVLVEPLAESSLADRSTTVRKLCGFVTSGGYSSVLGRAVGVACVEISDALLGWLWSEMSGANKEESWKPGQRALPFRIALWLRDVDSLEYNPCWLEVSRAGPASYVG